MEEDNIDVHVGGFLSNICLACMPVWEDAKIVNMISVCLDTTLTTSALQPLQLPPPRLRAGAGGRLRADADQDGQEVAHRLRRLFLGPVDARRLCRAKSRRTAAKWSAPPAFRSARRHDAVPVEDLRRFRRPVRHLLRQGRCDHRQPGLRSRPDQEVQMGRRRLDLASRPTCRRMGNKIDGFIAINRYIPVFQGPLDTPYHHQFFDEAKKRLAKIDPSGPLPDKYVQSNYEALNALKIAMEKSKFEGRDDTMKLIEALEGLEVKAERRLPAGRQDAAQGRPSGLPARVHLQGHGRDYKLLRDGAEGQDHGAAGLHTSLRRK